MQSGICKVIEKLSSPLKFTHKLTITRTGTNLDRVLLISIVWILRDMQRVITASIAFNKYYWSSNWKPYHNIMKMEI